MIYILLQFDITFSLSILFQEYIERRQQKEEKMKKLLMIILCLVFFAATLGVAYAQFAKPGDAIKYRKSVMFLISQHFGRMGAMVKEKVAYNKEVFSQNAMLVETLSRLPWEAVMVPGSDNGDTTLKASAIEQQAEFNDVAQNFETQATKLVSIAKEGDLTGIKTQFGEVAKSCKACHGQFRTK
jgi:cytochrome c556